MKRREPMLKNDGYGRASTSSAYRNPDAPDGDRDQQTPRNRVPVPVTVPVERPYYRSLEWYLDNARVELGMKPLNSAFFADHSTSQQPSHHSQQVREGGHANRPRSPSRRSRSRSHSPIPNSSGSPWYLRSPSLTHARHSYAYAHDSYEPGAHDERTVRRGNEQGAHGRERTEPQITHRGRGRESEHGGREREGWRNSAGRRVDKERRFEGGENKDYRGVVFEEPMETCRDDRGRGYPRREREMRHRDRDYGCEGEHLRRDQGESRGHREERPLEPCRDDRGRGYARDGENRGSGYGKEGENLRREQEELRGHREERRDTRRTDERNRDGRDRDGVRHSVPNDEASVQNYRGQDDAREGGQRYEDSNTGRNYRRERGGRERDDEGPINQRRDSREEETERDTREQDSTMESVVRERDDEWRSEDVMEEYGGEERRNDRFEFGYDIDEDLAQPMEIRTTPRITVSEPMDHEVRREHREEKECDADEETDTESEPDQWSDPVLDEPALESYSFENGDIDSQNGWSGRDNGTSGREKNKSDLIKEKNGVEDPKSHGSETGTSCPEKGARGSQNGTSGLDKKKSGSGLDKNKRDGKYRLLRDKTGGTKRTKRSRGKKGARVVEEDDDDVIFVELSPEEIARRNKAKEELLSVTWKENQENLDEDREMAPLLSLKECVKVVSETRDKQKELRKREFTAGSGFRVVQFNDEVAIRKAIRNANKREGGDIAAKVAEMSRAWCFGNDKGLFLLSPQAFQTFKWSMQHNLESENYDHLQLAGYGGEKLQKNKCLFKPNVHKARAQRMLIEKDWGRKGLHVFSDLADVTAEKKETVPHQVKYLKRNEASLEFGMPDLHIRSKEDCWKCNHKGPCVNNRKCACWRYSTPMLSEDGRVDQKYYFATHVIVCGPLCGCEGKCKNTLKLDGTGVKMEIFRNHQVFGYELRTLEPIAIGQFVIAFVGDLVFHDMFMRIPREEAKKHTSYAMNLFSSDEHLSEGSFMGRPYKNNPGPCPLFAVPPWMENGRALDVDPLLRGNEARFIRHSCVPNLFAVRVFLNTRNPQQSTIALFASEPLVPGEILSFDYGEHFVTENFGNCCHCGTRKCPVKMKSGSLTFTAEKVAANYRRYLEEKIKAIEEYKVESVDGEETADEQEEVFEEVKDLPDPLPQQEDEDDVVPEGVVADNADDVDEGEDVEADGEDEAEEDEEDDAEDSEYTDEEDDAEEDEEDPENPDGEEDAEAEAIEQDSDEEEDEVEVITIDDSD